MIQNRAAHLVFNQIKRAQVTICFILLHCLPGAATLLRNHWRLPQVYGATHQNPAVLSWSLRSASERHMVIPPSCGIRSKIKPFPLATFKQWTPSSSYVTLHIPNSRPWSNLNSSTVPEQLLVRQTYFMLLILIHYALRCIDLYIIY